MIALAKAKLQQFYTAVIRTEEWYFKNLSQLSTVGLGLAYNTSSATVRKFSSIPCLDRYLKVIPVQRCFVFSMSTQTSKSNIFQVSACVLNLL